MDTKQYTKCVDYSLESSADRLKCVENALGDANDFYRYFSTYYNPNLNMTSPTSEQNYVSRALEYMASYILYAKDLKIKGHIEIKPKYNSYTRKAPESLDEFMENPMRDETRIDIIKRNTYTNPKPTISEVDEWVPNMKELREGIAFLDAKLKSGELEAVDQYRLKHMLIDMRREQYALKDIFVKQVGFRGAAAKLPVYDWDEDTKYTDANGKVHIVSENKIDITKPNHVYELLKLYSSLRQNSWEDPQSDMRYVLDSLDDAIEKTNLTPARKWILIRKIDGKDNNTIAEELKEFYDLEYRDNYISTIFKKEICGKIADSAQMIYDKWKARNNPALWKKCSCCGELKLRDSREFVKKVTSKDGLSARCKTCDKAIRDKKTSKEAK